MQVSTYAYSEADHTHHCKLIFVQMAIFIYVTQVPNLTTGNTMSY